MTAAFAPAAGAVIVVAIPAARERSGNAGWKSRSVIDWPAAIALPAVQLGDPGRLVEEYVRIAVPATAAVATRTIWIAVIRWIFPGTAGSVAVIGVLRPLGAVTMSVDEITVSPMNAGSM